MIADLHTHYPMHVAVEHNPSTLDELRRLRDRPLGDKIRTAILRGAMRVGSDQDLWSQHRVSVEELRRGNVRLAYSVLYCPAEEFKPFRRPPEDRYFGKLIQQLDEVEADLSIWDDDVARVVQTTTELDEVKATPDGIALVHCVEGGFHLGDSTDRIAENVKTLADRGVAYITLAHLFYREVATNTNALPFMKDKVYNFLFRQPRDEGLTERGVAAVEAMAEHRVIVDISHMSAKAIDDSFETLERVNSDMPVIASHAGYRFKDRQPYMLDEATIRRVKDRGGVVGLIMAQHQLNDGLVNDTETLEESFAVISQHIDRIAEISEGYETVALGTDLDGFIRPTMGGIESASDLALLEEMLASAYPDHHEAIAFGNAERVLRAAWS